MISRRKPSSPRMKWRINPGALVFFTALLFTGKRAFAAVFLAAAFHEVGHLLAARRMGIALRCMELDLFGAKLIPAAAIPSYRAEWILAAGGPLFSVLLALILLPFHAPFAVALRLASASFAAFNLLPVSGFDGGRMFFATLARLLPMRTAEILLRAGTYLTLLLLFCLSSCLLLRYGQNLPLFVLCAVLFAKIFLPAGSFS